MRIGQWAVLAIAVAVVYVATRTYLTWSSPKAKTGCHSSCGGCVSGQSGKSKLLVSIQPSPPRAEKQ